MYTNLINKLQITGEISTDINGNAIIYELDGIPAADIYKKKRSCQKHTVLFMKYHRSMIMIL